MTRSKVRLIDGKAVYTQPGIYQLTAPLANPYFKDGFWPKSARFVVQRHIDKIGAQNAYEHYSIRLVTNKAFLVKSYQHEKWNAFIGRFRMVADDVEGYISFGEIPPLAMLDQL